MAVTPRPVTSSELSGRRLSGGAVKAAELDAFYRQFFLPLVRRAIRRHGLSNEDACDVVQEAFVVALVKMGAEGNAIAWLKQVVDFLAVNLKRTSSRRARLRAQWMSDGDRTQPRFARSEEI